MGIQNILCTVVFHWNLMQKIERENALQFGPLIDAANTGLKLNSFVL